MDRRVIEQKLESLRRCLTRIEAKCPPDAGALAADADVQDIVSLNLTRAVQLAVDIGAHLIAGMEVAPPDTMGQTFDRLAEAGLITGELATRLKKAVGFRNIAIHNYEAIDWAIVHSICRHRLSDFTDYARAVQAALSIRTG
ncbi:MAG: DUF86 domain-containing protein [Hydrogenophilaceae bacterium]|nr:DUF86 domain-containing protein [Hydrogenophilaceae bacterium]